MIWDRLHNPSPLLPVEDEANAMIDDEVEVAVAPSIDCTQMAEI